VSKLSSRLSARSASPRDAEGILAVGIARDIEDLGAPDWVLDDVREELAEAERAWVVEDEAGRVLAAALLAGDGYAHVLVHPAACGQGVGTHLRELVEASAPAGSVLRQEVNGSNDQARGLLEGAGYRAEQHYWRMAMGLEAPLAAAAWPERVSTRRYAPEDLAETETLVRESLPDFSGNLAARRVASDLSTVARAAAGGSLAGVVLCERREGQGFVSYLAVAPEWRGRGLGRALLADALTRMRAAGLERAALGVNGRNESATALYRSVGMRIENRADRYDKRLP
jgi:ribosomal protein S18 acetylase RimI-like enzyme